jgi:hypothetical protein
MRDNSTLLSFFLKKKKKILFYLHLVLALPVTAKRIYIHAFT